mgnify:FL=1
MPTLAANFALLRSALLRLCNDRCPNQAHSTSREACATTSALAFNLLGA